MPVECPEGFSSSASRENPASSPEVFYEWSPTPRSATPEAPHESTISITKPSNIGSKRRFDSIMDTHSKPPPQATAEFSPLGTESPTVSSKTRLETIKEALSMPTPPQRPSSIGSETRRRAIQTAMSGSSAGTTPQSSSLSSDYTQQTHQSVGKLVLVPSGSGSKASSNRSAAAQKKIAPIFFGKEQQLILEKVKQGQSLFYTGSAGTGKSLLLREIISYLKDKFKKKTNAVAVTASTGIAACNIGGITIHSFAGIGLGQESAANLAAKVRNNPKATARWADAKVLVIDEVSMLDGDLFDKLAHVGAVLRRNTKSPFGGLQVIITGDFFQLPPVATAGGNFKFAFEAETWSKAVGHTYNLTKVYRQNDTCLIEMLNDMRLGKLTQEAIKKFKSLARPLDKSDGILPTELFPLRTDVEYANINRMLKLATRTMKFVSQDGGSLKASDARTRMLSNFMAPALIELREEAQVMLIKNIDENLVNGSLGRVVRFADPALYGTEDDDGFEAASDTARAVPLSRAKLRASKSQARSYPVVEFVLQGGSKRELLVMPETWKVETPDGDVPVQRTQLPLILAWALSIHKSQGQTLDRVKVDLGRVFEKGQAYVALSRATSLEGLQVLNFDPDKVKAHQKVIDWSRTLSVIS